MTTSGGHNQTYGFEEAVRWFIEAQLRGQEPDIERLVSRYPEAEQQMRQKIQEFQRVNSLLDSLVQTDDRTTDHGVIAHDLAGQEIGGFQIVGMIGRGGMGVVYLAHDLKLDRSVAIKGISTELQADPNARMRIKREARLLASLNHPNIAVIHDIVEREKGASYLILEYVPGETLAELISQRPLELKQALSIGRQVAEALSAAHAKGVTHRDLKPSNIKVTPEGTVKVLDFGLAKVVGSDPVDQQSTITQPGRVLGTPAYMSPEQARGRSTDHRTDVWSFGCIMYEMLTGHLPFKGETAVDTLARVIEREPDWERLPERTPKGIRALVQGCLEKDPQRRLRSMHDIVVTLQDPVSAWQNSPPQTEQAQSDSTRPMVDSTSALSSAAEPIRSIVVLPFENLSSDPEQEYFVDGMTDALSAELGKIKALRVISRTSAMRYKHRDRSVREIARELGVDAVIEGSVLKVGSDVRITAQLVDGRIDTHLWSENYTGTLANILALQSEVTLAIAQEIEIALTPNEERLIIRRKPVKPEAYEAYLKGIFFMEKHTAEGYRTAAMHFKRAIQIQPDYAEAHAWLGGAHWVPSLWGYAAPHESFSKAKIAMDTAVQLDETCAEAIGGVGWIALYYDWDWRKAKESLEKSIELNPNYVYGYHGLAWYWVAAGHLDPATDAIQRAIKLDPLSHVLNESLATIYWYSGRGDEAARQHERTLELVPQFVTALVGQAEQYLSMSMPQKAIELIERAMDTAGRTPRLIAMLGRAYAGSGMKHQVDAVLHELQEHERNRYVSPTHFAALHVSLERYEEAFEWLSKAYADHDPMMIFLRVAPSWEPLRCDPRFESLLRQMHFPG